MVSDRSRDRESKSEDRFRVRVIVQELLAFEKLNKWVFGNKDKANLIKEGGFIRRFLSRIQNWNSFYYKAYNKKDITV